MYVQILSHNMKTTEKSNKSVGDFFEEREIIFNSTLRCGTSDKHFPIYRPSKFNDDVAVRDKSQHISSHNSKTTTDGKKSDGSFFIECKIIFNLLPRRGLQG